MKNYYRYLARQFDVMKVKDFFYLIKYIIVISGFKI